MPTASEFRALVASAHTRWERLHLLQRDVGGEVEAWLRHGELGYEPICSCCPPVFSEVSHRLEHGDDHVETGFPDGYEIAVDVRTGIVVSDRPAVSGPWPFWGPGSRSRSCRPSERRTPQAGRSSASTIR